MNNVRTRFAPSPTGPLHIGGARTALFCYLFAKQHGGSFVLRIEDTDGERSKKEFEESIFDGLRWLGVQWDEGPDIGGGAGPYRQSEKKDRYATVVEELATAGNVYPCFCSPEELEMERVQRETQHLPPRYSGKCRDALREQREAWEQEGRRPVYRFRTMQKEVSFTDLVRGRVDVQAELLDDFIVAKQNNEILYNLAVVIDDADMKISHVIRGEDHLTNTSKQILLYEALGWKPPTFAHLPLLLGTNRAKLSKRDAATSVLEYRDGGYLPEALVNFLALLGWNPKTEQEIFSLDDLIKQFRLEHVQKAGAVVDPKKLDHINGLYIRSLTPEALAARSGDRLGTLSPAAIRLVQDRLVTLNDLEKSLQFLVDWKVPNGTLLTPKKGNAQRTFEALVLLKDYFATLDDAAFHDEKKLEEKTRSLIESRGFSTQETLWPLRVALTGLEHSPGVFAVATFLGKEEIVRRVGESLKSLA